MFGVVIDLLKKKTDPNIYYLFHHWGVWKVITDEDQKIIETYCAVNRGIDGWVRQEVIFKSPTPRYVDSRCIGPVLSYHISKGDYLLEVPENIRYDLFEEMTVEEAKQYSLWFRDMG